MIVCIHVMQASTAKVKLVWSLVPVGSSSDSWSSDIAIGKQRGHRHTYCCRPSRPDFDKRLASSGRHGPLTDGQNSRGAGDPQDEVAFNYSIKEKAWKTRVKRVPADANRIQLARKQILFESAVYANVVMSSDKGVSWLLYQLPHNLRNRATSHQPSANTTSGN